MVQVSKNEVSTQHHNYPELPFVVPFGGSGFRTINLPKIHNKPKKELQMGAQDASQHRSSTYPRLCLPSRSAVDWVQPWIVSSTNPQRSKLNHRSSRLNVTQRVQVPNI